MVLLDQKKKKPKAPKREKTINNSHLGVPVLSSFCV